METWMLLRGLSRQKLHWGDFAEHLASRSQHKVLFQDFPGFGSLNHVSSPKTIHEIALSVADQVFAQVDEHDGKINLLGISMGGMVALELAHMFPKKVRLLVLVNTSFKPYAHFYQRLKPSAYTGFLKAWFSPLISHSERQILNLSSNFRRNEQGLLDEWLAFRREQKPSHAAAVNQMIAASRFKFPYGKPIDNVLLIASEKDRIVDAQCSLNVAEAWDADCILHHFAGHDLPLDSPEWLATEIVKWRRGLGLYG